MPYVTAQVQLPNLQRELQVLLSNTMYTGNSPSYLSDLVTTTANIPSVIHLRSARTRRYEPLTTRLKFGERFSHAGPKA